MREVVEKDKIRWLPASDAFRRLPPARQSSDWWEAWDKRPGPLTTWAANMCFNKVLLPGCKLKLIISAGTHLVFSTACDALALLCHRRRLPAPSPRRPLLLHSPLPPPMPEWRTFGSASAAGGRRRCQPTSLHWQAENDGSRGWRGKNNNFVGSKSCKKIAVLRPDE